MNEVNDANKNTTQSYGTSNTNSNMNGNQSTNAYGNSTGTNSYANYAGNNSAPNGAYQYNAGYNNYAPSGAGSSNPPKKKKKGKKILAALLALVLVGGLGTGAVYVAKNKDISLKGLLASGDKKDAAATASTTQEADTSEEEQVVIATDVSSLVEKVMPSIVIIENKYMVDLEDYGYDEGEALSGGSGSGVIMGQNDTELLIATNNHVVEGADDLSVHFVNGTSKPAYIKGTNSGMDLAVISVSLSEIDDATMNAITFATVGDSDDLKLGEPAIAIGNALGEGQSVTVGVISALNRAVTNDDGSEGLFIQTDAAISPGNSGGALLNIKGELIGINSRKYVAEGAEGMGFAIPISVAKPIIDDLMESETKYKADKDNRGVLGVTAYTPTGVEGAYISSIDSDSAAEEAGLEVGDVIIKVQDAKIASRSDLDTNMAYYEAGQTITITVLRKGSNGYEEVEVEVTLKEQKSSSSSSKSDSKDDYSEEEEDQSGSDEYEEETPEDESGEEDDSGDSEDSEGGDDFGF